MVQQRPLGAVCALTLLTVQSGRTESVGGLEHRPARSSTHGLAKLVDVTVKWKHLCSQGNFWFWLLALFCSKEEPMHAVFQVEYVSLLQRQMELLTIFLLASVFWNTALSVKLLMLFIY